MHRHTRHLTRRVVLTTGAAAAALIAAPAIIGRAGGQPRAWAADPFSLGVASGSPAADGFVIWTRLAPEPLSPDPRTPGGMSGGPVELAYDIAADPEMRNIVRTGAALADPAFGYSVHAEIAGLMAGRFYFYRFRSGAAASRIGRAMTSVPSGMPLDRLRLGFVSCSNYEQGYFAAYRHLAGERPDLVLYLGDYIYENVDRRSPDLVRRHSDDMEAVTLGTYRNRYAQYRLDPDLQLLHAEAPALVTWDDHEVQNDYAASLSWTFDLPQRFLERRSAAYQAYYEFMPLRAVARPAQNMRLYERFAFGDLAEIAMLDLRQYRSRTACYGPGKGGAHLETDSSCPERLDATRSILGPAQEEWLYDGLSGSRARWNVIGQSTLMAHLRQRNAQNEVAFWTDDWNGFPANRRRLLEHLHQRRIANPVVLGGDLHSFWANDLKLDFNDPASPVVATEFVGTSVSSYPPPYETFAPLLPDNPHVKFFESRMRGYSVIDVLPQSMNVRFRAISDGHDPAATVSTLRSWAVEAGRPGAVAA
jgi:alkaline phosphatase D